MSRQEERTNENRIILISFITSYEFYFDRCCWLDPIQPTILTRDLDKISGDNSMPGDLLTPLGFIEPRLGICHTFKCFGIDSGLAVY